MNFRKLRIAWSVFWGLACVLLIVLWVRSYWWFDTLPIQNRFGKHGISAIQGKLMWDRPLGVQSKSVWQGVEPYMKKNFGITSFRLDEVIIVDPRTQVPGFELPGHRSVTVPIWIPTLAAAALAAIPWIPWRLVFVAPLSGALAAVAPWLKWTFSLRTLLIAMTQVALVLGLIAWSMR
jgi:hypothetical protein